MIGSWEIPENLSRQLWAGVNAHDADGIADFVGGALLTFRSGRHYGFHPFGFSVSLVFVTVHNGFPSSSVSCFTKMLMMWSGNLARSIVICVSWTWRFSASVRIRFLLMQISNAFR